MMKDKRRGADERDTGRESLGSERSASIELGTWRNMDKLIFNHVQDWYDESKICLKQVHSLQTIAFYLILTCSKVKKREFVLVFAHMFPFLSGGSASLGRRFLGAGSEREKSGPVSQEAKAEDLGKEILIESDDFL